MAIENFTTYTEVDDAAYLTVAAARATGVNCIQDINARLYKDSTAGEG